MLHVFRHVHSSYGTTTLRYDDTQKESEAQHLGRISEALEGQKLQQVTSGSPYIPPDLCPNPPASWSDRTCSLSFSDRGSAH